MRPTSLHSLLKASFQHRQRVLITGKPGVGKTDIVGHVCKELGYNLLISHPAVSDPVDYKGAPAVVNGGAEFLPFGDLRKLIEADKPTISFLDDMGQASQSVQAAVMQLVLGHQVNGHRLSEHVVFCGATNRGADFAGVSGMIEPLKSRWGTIVELEVSVDDWVMWALSNGIAPEVIGFIRNRPELLSDFKPTRELTNSPSPRGWASVSKWLEIGMASHEVIVGAVGKGASAEFMAFLELAKDMPDPDAILLNPDSAPLPATGKGSIAYAVIVALASRVTVENFGAAMRYAKRLSKPFEVLFVKDTFNICKSKGIKIEQTPEFVQWACQKEHRDAWA